MSYTTDDLIRQVRSQTREKNTNDVSDATILDALNRGQDYAFDIMAKNYPDPMITKADDVTVDSNNEIDIYETSFEDRIAKVEVYNGSMWRGLRRISFSEIADIDGTNYSGTPLYYAVVGKKIRILPSPTSGYTFRIWYLKEIQPLVKQQGRISQVGTVAGGSSAPYVVVDSLGSSLSESSDYGKYVNVIDAQTGEVKCSLQIDSINTSTKYVQFKTSPTRSSVINNTISSDIASTVQVDDYLASIDGTCVPYFKKPLTNFIIQYATAEIRRSLGYDVSMEERVLKKMEDQFERTWAGRENTKRIKRRNPIWMKNFIR